MHSGRALFSFATGARLAVLPIRVRLAFHVAFACFSLALADPYGPVDDKLLLGHRRNDARDSTIHPAITPLEAPSGPGRVDGMAGDLEFHDVRDHERMPLQRIQNPHGHIDHPPRWVTSTNTTPHFAEAWARHLKALMQHELGHGQNGVAAAEELGRRIQKAAEGPTCDAVKQAINEIGQRTIDEFRQRDKDYDERTRHGAAQGAVPPGQARR